MEISDTKLCQNGIVNLMPTAEKIAKQTGVSERTIHRDAKLSEALDKITDAAGPETTQKILKEEIKMPKKDVVELSSKPKEDQKEIVSDRAAV